MIYIYRCMFIYMVQMYVYISSCYGSIPLTSGLIGKDTGLSTQCHRCRFAYKQRVLKTLALAISAPRME